MKNGILKQIGLSELQSSVYLSLLDSGPTPPPLLARKLKLTRSNAYKILDQLVDMGLVGRVDLQKKLHYKAEDPIALASIVANERNRVIALESNVKEALTRLRLTYKKSSGNTEVQTFRGAEAVKSLYKHQATLKQTIRFIKSRADIPSMGFEVMDHIRRLPAKFGTQRFGIVPDAPESAANPAVDERSNLTPTWIAAESYTAPVEWTVADDELMIITFNETPSGIRIKNKVVADAFLQIWSTLDENLRAQPGYKKMPLKAKREI
jgi:predicted transcriptional regulator